MVWETKPPYGAGIVLLRVVSAFAPLAMLWVGKLIIDTAVANIGAPVPDWGLLGRLVALDLAIALTSDVLSRLTGLLESLLGDLFSNDVSVRLTRHARRSTCSISRIPISSTRCSVPWDERLF